MSTTTKLASFDASKGTHRDKVKLSWSYTNSADVPDRLIIKRNGTEIASISGTFTAYTDDEVPANGVEQLYTIQPETNSVTQMAYSAKGYSMLEGEISGAILTYGNRMPVEGATVRAVATVNGVTYAFTTTTNADGKYLFNNVFVGADPIDYVIKATFGTHSFLNNGQSVTLTAEK